jgi:hypothetical protein
VGENGELKRSSITPSGRRSIVEDAKYQRGFIIRPEQILDLFHDTQPGIPLPKDAQFQGIGMNDAGVDSTIEFHFTSVSAPNVHCFSMKPKFFFRTLVELADGLLPLDSELDGIEISSHFTVIMLRVKSSHWPAPLDKRLPLYHLRYEYGKLLLVDPSKSLSPERRIQIH